MNRSDLLNLRCREIPPSDGCLPTDRVASLLAMVPQWQPVDKKIERKIRFKNFISAMAFVNKIAQLAEEEQHHPDIFIHYNHVTLSLWTHTVDGVTVNDFIMAAKIDATYDSSNTR